MSKVSSLGVVWVAPSITDSSRYTISNSPRYPRTEPGRYSPARSTEYYTSQASSSSRYSSGRASSPPSSRHFSSAGSYSRYISRRHAASPGSDGEETGPPPAPDPAPDPGPVQSKSRTGVTVLNEGAVVIRRPGGPADTSDEVTLKY